MRSVDARTTLRGRFRSGGSWKEALAGGLLAAAVGVGCAFNAPGYQGPKSDHFDGTHFSNPGGVHAPGLRALLRWMTHRERGPWYDSPDAPPGPPPPRRVGDGELRVTFVNHATTLIQLDGVNILTDPIWSARASPVSFLGPHRVRPPGIRFEDLPPIDLVLVSHSHYDHCDLNTLKRLQDAFRPRIYSGLGNSLLFRQKGIARAHDLDWWQSVEVKNGVKLTLVPAQHTSRRGLTDGDQTLWAGFVIQGRNGYVYFAGDTGFGPRFQQIRERFGAPRLAILPIGAFRPEWFMAPIHISPEEALKAHRTLGALRSMAIHFGTFALADDGETEPVESLQKARQREGEPAENFWVLDFGEGRDVPKQEGAR